MADQNLETQMNSLRITEKKTEKEKEDERRLKEIENSKKCSVKAKQIAKLINVQNRLVSAVCQGDVDTVKEITKSYKLSHCEFWGDGYFLLCNAIRNQRTEVAELLLSLNCRIKEANEDMRFEGPLHLSMKKCDVTFITKLLDQGALINAQDLQECTPLHLAVSYNREDVVELLLNRKAAVNVCNVHGLSPLHTACKHQKLNLVSTLLNHGAHIDKMSNDKLTPLHLAALTNSYDVVKLLISKGAAINAKNYNNETPLNLAFYRRNTNIISFLIESGASIHHLDSDGKSLLHLAAEIGNYELTELFTQKNLDVNATMRDNVTPLYLAVKNGHHEVAALLLNKNADLNITPKKFFFQILRPITTVDRSAMTQLLLEKKSDVKVEKNVDCPPIYLAALSGDKRMCELLFNSKANLNVVDTEGKSCLYVAVEKGYFDVAEFLLMNDADVNKQTKGKMFPLDAAACSGNEKIFSLLLTHGADPKILMDGNKSSILRRAVTQSYPLVVETILDHCDVVTENFDDLLKVAVLESKKDDEKFCRIVNKLFDFGFRIRVDDKNIENIVSNVIFKGYFEIFADLLKSGLDVNLPIIPDYEKSGRILHTAIKFNQEAMVELLISEGADVHCIVGWNKKSSLFMAIEGKNPKIIELLVTKADINQKIDAFIHAVSSDDIETVKYFIQHGFDVTLKNSNGKTALQFTAGDQLLFKHRFDKKIKESNKGEMVSLLLDNGADKYINTEIGTSIFMIAVKNRYLSVVETLLNHNIDVNCKYVGYHCVALWDEEIEGIKDYDLDDLVKPFCHALHIATNECCIEIVKLLLKWNADVNCRTEENLSPLHVAIWQENLEIVKLLLTHNADVNSKDVNGMTPIQLAAVRRDEDIFKLLLDYDADISLLDAYKKNLDSYLDAGYYRYTDMMMGTFGEDEGRYYCGENDPQFPMMQFLKQHMIKLKVANLLINEKNLAYLSPMTMASDFQEQCEKELKKIKCKKVENSSVSFYDLLLDASAHLGKFQKNALDIIKTDTWIENYPLYGCLIRSKVKIAEKEKDLAAVNEMLMSLKVN